MDSSRRFHHFVVVEFILSSFLLPPWAKREEAIFFFFFFFPFLERCCALDICSYSFHGYELRSSRKSHTYPPTHTSHPDRANIHLALLSPGSLLQVFLEGSKSLFIAWRGIEKKGSRPRYMTGTASGLSTTPTNELHAGLIEEIDVNPTLWKEQCQQNINFSVRDKGDKYP